MVKMANKLKELDKSAEENYKKARLSFRMGRFEEALAAYLKAAESWKEI
jgi:tetratricopeptide (TPR) repeat protein